MRVSVCWTTGALIIASEAVKGLLRCIMILCNFLARKTKNYQQWNPGYSACSETERTVGSVYEFCVCIVLSSV